MLSIITPVFGHAQMVSEFITSLVPYLDDNSELILVDNNSPDNSLNSMIAAKRIYNGTESVHTGKHIKILANDRNVGFGAGNNLGVSVSRGDQLLFLSDDVKILGDCIKPISNYLYADGNSACGPRLISFDTGWNTYKETSVIPYIEGFCMAMQRRHFDMIGGFDEKFFIDMEDIEISYRLHLAGVGLAQITLPVMHILGGSFDNLPSHRSEYTVASVNYFMKKWNLTK